MAQSTNDKAAGRAEAGFDFGENWDRYSRDVLDEARLEAAVASLSALLGAGRFAGASVCDVGCGSGLFSLAAARLGAARVLGFDVNPTAVTVAGRNLARFGAPEGCAVAFRQGSALDADFTGSLGRFDLVYAWGSLHHTGAMDRAIANAARLVGDGGTFTLAIYNRHWTAPVWWWIKRLYCRMPPSFRPAVDTLFGGLIFLATWAVTGSSPLKKERGMEFWVDVTDWLGGYPYEYASAAEMTERLAALGFTLERVVPPRVPTGCNELVFRRTAQCS